MNRSIKAMLATLPYREMRELSKEICSELVEADNESYLESMADTLAGLAGLTDTEAATKEQELLHSQFTRKKQITIQPYENGFKISVPAQNIDVYSDDVRDGLSQVLDNLVVMRAMN